MTLAALWTTKLACACYLALMRTNYPVIIYLSYYFCNHVFKGKYFGLFSKSSIYLIKMTWRRRSRRVLQKLNNVFCFQGHSRNRNSLFLQSMHKNLALVWNHASGRGASIVCAATTSKGAARRHTRSALDKCASTCVWEKQNLFAGT